MVGTLPSPRDRMSVGYPTHRWSDRKHTLAKRVFKRSDRFFSEASARGTSITSANCLPSLSWKRALKEPAGPSAMAVTSCWMWERSSSSRLCRLDGGGTIVAIVKGAAVVLVKYLDGSRRDGGAVWQNRQNRRNFGGEYCDGYANRTSGNPHVFPLGPQICAAEPFFPFPSLSLSNRAAPIPYNACGPFHPVCCAPCDGRPRMRFGGPG